jgi:hypothetical protein
MWQSLVEALRVWWHRLSWPKHDHVCAVWSCYDRGRHAVFRGVWSGRPRVEYAKSQRTKPDERIIPKVQGSLDMQFLFIIIFAVVIFLFVVGIGRGQRSRGRRTWHTTPCQNRSDLTEALKHITSLPYLDEHETVIAAGANDVWRNLCETLDRSFSRPGVAIYARLVGSADCTASGPRPFAEGSTFPGFRVIAAVPRRELVLEGCHRFSSYALIFRLDHVSPDRSRLRAESRAAFPGLAGSLYRLIVIGSGGHVVGMRRLLSAIRRPWSLNGER